MDNILELIDRFIDIKVKLNPWFIGGIVLMLMAVKKADTKKKILSKWYFAAAMILGFIFGILTIPGPIELRTALYYGFAHGFASMGLYEFKKYILPGKENVFGWGSR